MINLKMSTQDFIFSNPSPTSPTVPTPLKTPVQKKKRKNSGGRPKSVVWGNHVVQGSKISEEQHVYCGYFWRKGSPQDIEGHLANRRR